MGKRGAWIAVRFPNRATNAVASGPIGIVGAGWNMMTSQTILAETSRTPFDLQEAESELVAGFFTEHSSVPFVFFFLAEYSSIVLFSCITAILFLGGYHVPEIFVNDSFINLQSIILGLKTCIFCFLFV